MRDYKGLLQQERSRRGHACAKRRSTRVNEARLVNGWSWLACRAKIAATFTTLTRIRVRIALPARPWRSLTGSARFLWLVPVLLLAYWVSTMHGNTAVPAVKPSASPFAAFYQDPQRMLGYGLALKGKAHATETCYTANTGDGGVATLSLVPQLQQQLDRYLVQSASAYAAVLVFDPNSGRVLAASAHSTVDPQWQRHAFTATYPMASLFKLVTASAAFEGGVATPNSSVAYLGRFASDTPGSWHAGPGRGQISTITNAMAHSANPVFGNLAADTVGSERISAAIARTGFNRQLLHMPALQASSAPVPVTPIELRRQGAGLEKSVRVSPLHVAMLLSAVAGDGRAIVPSLVDTVTLGPEQLYRQQQTALPSFFSAPTAQMLRQSMSTTVYSGTARKSFSSPTGRKVLAHAEVAAKTGSINGTEPEGYYNWFVALVPRQHPRVAVVALVINRALWRIKGGDLGAQALADYFDLEALHGVGTR